MFNQRFNRMGKTRVLFTIILLIGALFFWNFAFADVPQQIFFQAKISKADGKTAGGSHSIVFKFYSASTGGSALWTETQTLSADASGIFSCYLGSTTSFPSTLDFNSTYYLSMNVDSDGEMSPRIKLVPALFALNSDRFDGLNSTQFLRSDTADTMEATLTFSGVATDIATASGEHFAIIPGGSGNVGIGTTSPSTFKLEVAGNIGPSADSTYDLGSSSVRWENIYADNISGNVTPTGFDSGGMVFGSTGGLLIQDTSNLYWNNSNNRVGIGTSDPVARLEIKGAGTGTTFALKIQDGDGADKVAFLDNGNVGVGNTAPEGLLDVGTTPGVGLIVLTSGKVGIGTTQPGAKLGFVAATTAAGGIDFGTDTNLYRSAADTLKTDDSLVVTGSITTGSLSSSGNLDMNNNLILNIGSADTDFTSGGGLNIAGSVGIGTTAPTAVLHLKAGTTAPSSAPLKLTSGSNLTTAEAGAMEFDGTNLYFTPSTTRRTLEHQGNKGAASGYASLNSSSLVVENPANATATATASKIPIADASAKLDTWVTLGSAIEDGEIPATITRDTEWDTAAEINAATTDDDFATLTGTQTLTNKTIAAASNTLTGVARTDAANTFGAYNQTFDTSTLFVDATSDRVGIGTTGPDYLLHISNSTETNAVGISTTGITYAGTAQPKRTIVLTASGGIPTTTTGADQTQLETTTNRINYYTLDFDQSTDEYATWQFVVPDSYTGTTVTAKVYWQCNATTGNAIWGIQSLGLVDDGAMDSAWGTAVTVTDGATAAANDLLVTAETSSITTGWTAGGLAFVRLYRDADNASDTLAVDARLICVRLEWSAATESD
ncbi:MAG: hypothetical protein KKH29_03695 [Candidatus Omnitrophica bacterium]|nr:hypothetical protein [Candidatus Omnitrophota bacterium]MCG2706795.1 hypothetical protein [Candidatus Omnitrophota bacterium]